MQPETDDGWPSSVQKSYGNSHDTHQFHHTGDDEIQLMEIRSIQTMFLDPPVDEQSMKTDVLPLDHGGADGGIEEFHSRSESRKRISLNTLTILKR